MDEQGASYPETSPSLLCAARFIKPKFGFGVCVGVVYSCVAWVKSDRLLGPEMIRKIGLRPGDKLHEQLFATDEERQPTSISGIYQATPRSDTLPVSMDNLAASLEAALTAADVAAANAAFAKERQAS